MSPADIYRRATELGLRIKPAGDNLAVFPKGQCPAEFADTLRLHKAELLDWLNHPPCPGWQSVPPPDLSLNPGMPNPSMARFEAITGYLWRQTCDRTGPLAAWLLQRENAYYDGPGRKWDCRLLCYAAARDAASWQLARSEGAVLEFLEVLRDLFLSARDDTTLNRDLPSRVSQYLSERSLNEWNERLCRLKGEDLILAASKLYAECTKELQRQHRQPHELIVYEVDWSLRPDELAEHFRAWANANRVHPSRKRTGGHPSKAVERLRALGAKRLLEFFRRSPSDWPEKYRNITLYPALSEYSQDQRTNAGRPNQPLYGKPSNWLDAEKSATQYLLAVNSSAS